jgi:hypothetical protein
MRGECAVWLQYRQVFYRLAQRHVQCIFCVKKPAERTFHTNPNKVDGAETRKLGCLRKTLLLHDSYYYFHVNILKKTPLFKCLCHHLNKFITVNKNMKHVWLSYIKINTTKTDRIYTESFAAAVAPQKIKVIRRVCYDYFLIRERHNIRTATDSIFCSQPGYTDQAF